MAFGQNTATIRSTPSQNAPVRRFGTVPAEIMGPRILFMLAVMALVLFGLVMVFSASTSEAISEGESPTSFVAKQLLFAVGGLALCVLCAIIPYRKWLTRWTLVIWALAVMLIVLTALMGTEELGATRWLQLGPVSLQPSEFAKIAFVLAAARAIQLFRTGEMDVRMFVASIFVQIAVPIAFLYVTQSDLGTMAICAVSILAVLWAGGISARTIGIVAGVLFAIAVVGIFSSPYRLARLTSFMNPWDDGKGGLGTGFQLIHSFYAFGEGGVLGVGLGNSSEKFLYLPEAETDFIYAVIGEELGLVGALAVVALFVLLLYAGLRIARTAPDNFGSMVACSITVMIVFQAFLNMACVIGVAPTTGKPLPFISSGGSSLVASFIMAGLVLSVSRQSSAPDEHDRRRADLRIVRADYGYPDESVQAGSRGRGRQAGRAPYRADDAASRRTPSRSGRRMDRAAARKGAARRRGEQSASGSQRRSRR